MTLKEKYFSGLTRDSFLLALTSLFADISTESLYPVLPIFLTQVLAAPVTIVGLVEGVAEASQNIIQGFSGWWADKIGRKKPVALFGYTLGAITKPFIGLSTIWPQVLVGRALDRLGSGTRSAPRDALIAASVDNPHRGKAFGLESIGDNLGAVIGPLLAVLIVFQLHLDLRWVFYLAVIPGLIAVALMFFVREKRIQPTAKTTIAPQKLPTNFWKYLGAIGLFSLGNSSNAFLILRSKNLGMAIESTIFVYALFNLVAAISSYPAGSLSDRFGRKPVLLLCLGVFLITYVGFAQATTPFLIPILFAFYGIYQGIFRAVGKAAATDLVPVELRATGVGFYSATIGLGTLVASIVAGQLWTVFSPSATFLYGATGALLGGLALLLI